MRRCQTSFNIPTFHVRRPQQGLSSAQPSFPSARALGHDRPSTTRNVASRGCIHSQLRGVERARSICRRSTAKAEDVLNDLGSLPAQVPTQGTDKLGKCTVQLGNTSLASVLAAVYTSHQLRLLGTAIAQQRSAGTKMLDNQNQAGDAGHYRPIQSIIEPALASPLDRSSTAQTGRAVVELEAAAPQTAANRQQLRGAAPAGEDARASHSASQHACLPASTTGQERRAHRSLEALQATDLKIAGSLKSTNATLMHFQAMIERDPQLAGQVGNEQIKMRAVLQVLQAKRCELLEIVEALQEEDHMEVLPTAATSCMAEADAFLLVADFTIKEARSRVLYSQAWPGQHSKGA